jgi:hypothetical protein
MKTVRNHWLFALALALTVPCSAAAPTGALTLVPRVDARVELLSIVFHLSGLSVYNMSPLTAYTADIDRYFAPYKDHPAVRLAKKLGDREDFDISAPMALAVHLSQPPGLVPIVPPDQIPAWGKDDATQFVKLLGDFYRDTNFSAFFENHRPLYQLAESRFGSVVSGVDLTWYPRFYGESPKGSYQLILSMNNGAASYGPRVILPDGTEERYAVIGCQKTDSSGEPAFDADYLPDIIHELNHSFINPLVHEHKQEFTVADRIYAPLAEKMRNPPNLYGDSEEMVQESLVRAGVILYRQSKGASSSEVQRMVIEEQARGFVWMDELYDLLRQYESQRNRYPTLRSFMPAILLFYRGLADRIPETIAGFNQKCAHVTGIAPFSNHSENVNPSTEEITVTFDKPLDPNRISILYGPEGQEHSPIFGSVKFLSGNRAIEIPLALKPNWTYSFVLSSLAFSTPDGYPLEDYTVTLKTGSR